MRRQIQTLYTAIADKTMVGTNIMGGQGNVSIFRRKTGRESAHAVCMPRICPAEEMLTIWLAVRTLRQGSWLCRVSVRKNVFGAGQRFAGICHVRFLTARAKRQPPCQIRHITYSDHVENVCSGDAIPHRWDLSRIIQLFP